MKSTPLSGFLVLVLSIATPVLGWSQWSISLGVEADRFWGGSLENAPEQKSFRPYRPTVLEVGVEHRLNRSGFALRARYTEASLGLEGEGGVVAGEGAFTVVGVAPEAIYQISTLGPGNRLRIHVGPVVEFWHPIDEEWRTRVGAHGALSLGVPLGGRLGLAFAGTLAVIPSPFRSDELLDQYQLRALWRRGFSAKVEYQM